MYLSIRLFQSKDEFNDPSQSFFLIIIAYLLILWSYDFFSFILNLSLDGNNWGWKCKPAQSVYGVALVSSICVELWEEIPLLIKQTTVLLPLKTVDWDKGCLVSAAVWHGLAGTRSPGERRRVLAWSLGVKRETAKPRWCHHLRRTVLKTGGTAWKLETA